MIWVPPPHWFIAILLALAAHVVVMGVIFYARGWKRGTASIPVGLVLFIVSVPAGVALDIALAPLDPVPLLIVLCAGIYIAYVLMMWRRKRPDDAPSFHPG